MKFHSINLEEASLWNINLWKNKITKISKLALDWTLINKLCNNWIKNIELKTIDQLIQIKARPKDNLKKATTIELKKK